MNYKELKAAHRREWEAFNVFYAFSNDQFNTAMKERGLSPDTDLDKIVSIGFNGYTTEEELPKIKEYLKRSSEELKEAMKDHDFAFDAFLEEIGNHEYLINYQGAYDTLSCFYDIEWNDAWGADEYLKSVNAEPQVVMAWHEALDEHKRLAEENGWY